MFFFLLFAEITCKEPEKDGAMTVHVSTFSVGGVAHYACPKGHNMQGNSTRICLKRGSWSGFIPKCIRKQAPHFVTIALCITLTALYSIHHPYSSIQSPDFLPLSLTLE